MKLILDLDSFGGRSVKLQKAGGIKEIKEKLDEESKRILFKNARMRPIQESSGNPPKRSARQNNG
jgi:hypothetical protein